MYDSPTIPFKEKLKLIPFAWCLLALIVGISAGLWSITTLPLVYFKQLRPYIVIVVFGALTSSFLFTDISKIPVNKNIEAYFTLTKKLSPDSYEARLISYTDSTEHNLNTNVIAVIYPPADTLFKVSDIIKATVFSENITPEISDRSFDNSLLKRGFRHRIVVNNKYPLYKNECGNTNIFTSLHDKAIERVNNSSLTAEAKSIVSAMLLGDKSMISKSVKRDFRYSGVSHMLAISGLHIGILFMILGFILKWLNFSFKTRILKTVIIIGILWIYTIIIGSPASAVRAAAMCTLFSIGSVRAVSSVSRYNTLCAAAFLMLIFNPATLYDIGFQLSFTAVAAILYAVPKVEKRIGKINIIVKYVIITATVTLSAQIAVTPLTMYYFGEFSAVTLVSNMLISPLIAPFILFSIGTTITLLPVFTTPTQILADTILTLTNSLRQLPYSHFTEITFSGADVIMCYTAYALILIYFEKKVLYLRSDN